MKMKFIPSLTALCGLCLAAPSVFAVNYYWDTNGSTAGSGAATGTWGTDTFFTTDSTGSIVPTIVTTGSLDAVRFSAGSNGTAGIVTVSGTQNASALTLQQPGLTFTGGAIELWGTMGNVLTVASSATINSALNYNLTTAQAANLAFSAGGQTLTLNGGLNNLNTTATGPSAIGTTAAIGATSTLQMNSGTYRILNYDIGDPTAGTAGAFLNAGAVASLANTIAVGTGTNGLLTVNGGLIANVSNTALVVGRNTGFGRIIVSSGTIALGGAGPLLVGFQTSTGAGQMDINGGVVSVAGDFAVGSSSAAGTAAVNITGGTTSVGKLDFGKGGTFAASTGGSGVLTMTGGSLYVGAGGIVKDGTGSYTSTMIVSGGTIGATAVWSSTVAMTLGTTNGNITFQAADAGAVARNITLSGALSGSGGLVKTGAGVLTLQGANTFTGNTVVNAGSLVLSSSGGLSFVIGANGVNNSLAANSTVSLDGTFTFDLTSAATTAGSSWTIVSDNANATYLSDFNVAGFTADLNGIDWTSGNYKFSEATGQLSVVPEPATFALLAVGGAVVMALRRRRA